MAATEGHVSVTNHCPGGGVTSPPGSPEAGTPEVRKKRPLCCGPALVETAEGPDPIGSGPSSKPHAERSGGRDVRPEGGLGLFEGGHGLVEHFLLFGLEVQLDDVADALASDGGGDADIETTVAVLTLQEG